MKTKLSEISNPQLVRLLLRQLWQRYDAGGISMGRSLRSRLLESAQGLLPFPHNLSCIDNFFVDVLIKEANSRNQDLKLQDFNNIKKLNNKALAFLLLIRLRAINTETESDTFFISLEEKQIIETSICLLGIPPGVELFSTEQLLNEFERRAFTVAERRYKKVYNFVK